MRQDFFFSVGYRDSEHLLTRCAVKIIDLLNGNIIL